MHWDHHLGWLLLAWRVRRDDLPGDLVRRWQQGEFRPTNADFTVEEVAAGQPEGSLTSVPDLLWLNAGGVNPRRTPATRVADGALLDVALAGQASPADWVVLADAIGADTLHLDSAEQIEQLVGVLLDALPRGVGHTYRQLRAAALTLIAVPALQEPFVGVIRRGADNTDGPDFLEPIGLLDAIATRSANALVIELLASPRNVDERVYAGWLAAGVWCSDGFDAEERSRVVMTVLAGWRADPARTLKEWSQLIDVLPVGVRKTLNRAIVMEESSTGQTSTGQTSTVPTRASPQIGRRITASLIRQSSQDLTPIVATLQELVETSLFETGSERRHQATQVLAASPFKADLGSAMLDLVLANDTTTGTRRRAAAMVNNFVTDGHRLRMLSLVNDDDATVAASITTAFGHIRWSAISDHAVRQALPPQRLPQGRACLYALGMTGSVALSTLANSRSAPPWQRHSAQWWLRAGPALG